jgi:aspartate kinase
MARLVLKFGGTSVADLARIRTVAEIVTQVWQEGHELAVVLSAMAGETNRLVTLARDAAPLYDVREYDTIVSTGEQVTVGLLAILLQNQGVPARSWLGWQLPLRTNLAHGNASIVEIDRESIEARFASERQVAVVAGFQGLASDGRITTLGRGGSDTSAVALAAALRAERCDIYTDVDGIYTTDPRIVPRARKLDAISHEEMLELASLGAKVLQTRSVSLAMRYGVPLRVVSTFDPQGPGTRVVPEEEIVEETPVSGVAFARNEAKITLNAVPDRPGVAAAIFERLSKAAINIDMIVQTVSKADATTEMAFTCARSDLARALAEVESLRASFAFGQIDSDDHLAKVSIVGIGMRSNSGVASQMFGVLADKGINIQVITTSEIKVSVLIAEEYLELAVRALHSAFDLDEPVEL